MRPIRLSRVAPSGAHNAVADCASEWGQRASLVDIRHPSIPREGLGVGYVHTIKMGAHVSKLKADFGFGHHIQPGRSGASLVEEGASQIAAVWSPLGSQGIHCSPLWYFLRVSDEKPSMAL